MSVPDAIQIQQEDIILDEISLSLSNLRQTSETIHTTLSKQDDMLDELHAEIEEADTFLRISTKKIDRLMSPSNRKKCCVVSLLVASLLLLFLIIYL